MRGENGNIKGLLLLKLLHSTCCQKAVTRMKTVVRKEGSVLHILCPLEIVLILFNFAYFVSPYKQFHFDCVNPRKFLCKYYNVHGQSASSSFTLYI